MLQEDNSNQNADIAGNAGLASSHTLLSDLIYDDLPDLLKSITDNFEGREKDIVLLSSLGVVSSCLPNVYGIYDRRKFYSNLYLFIIAPPASGKGVMTWSKLLIEPIHDKIITESKKRITNYQKTKNKETISKPGLQLKIIPGNTSATKLYNHINNSHDSLLIFESEADSLSGMLKQDWGDFSDVMRKGFQHETISISRLYEDTYFEIKNPKISIVLSGTPDQLKPLINSKENGLFSRFIFYFFDNVSEWKDVSPQATRIEYDKIFKDKSQEIYKLYKLLYFKKTPIEFTMNQEQWNTFQDKIKFAHHTINQNSKQDFLPIIKRMGVIFFRICMLLTVVRNINKIYEHTQELACEDIDITISIELMKSFIDHSLFVFDLYSKGSVYLPMAERILYNNLPKKFTRAVGLVEAKNSGIAERTFADILKRWQENKVIDKISHGKYEKLDIK